MLQVLNRLIYGKLQQTTIVPVQNVLLAVGADAKAENDAGKVPFDIAVEAEHYALAAVLAKAAGGINGRDKKGWDTLALGNICRCLGLSAGAY